MIKLFQGLLFIYVISIASTTYAQTERRVYFDKNWKVVPSTANYEYYRVVKLNSSGSPTGTINTYYVGGSIQWRGQFTSKNIECTSCEQCGCTGLCTWYYKNGQKSSEGQYQNGKEVGDTKYWDENGNETSIADKLSSEILIKTLIEVNIKDNKYQPLEGIWSGTEEIQIFINKEVMPSQPKPKRYGIINVDNQYKVFEIDKGLSGLEITSVNQRGEFVGKVNVQGLYGPAFEGAGKFIDAQNIRIVMEGSNEAIRLMLGKQYRDLVNDTELFTEIKIRKEYPSTYDIENIMKKAIKEAPKSGTGFALSSNGFIATNYHVIENANSIKVRGIKGNFSIMYNAKVIKSDQSADLAVIQIDDPNFVDLGKVPYSVITSSTEVGEEVFALGYPLTNTMGEEVKLTTGVISANSGFQGNQNQYQISVPIQPGNSGGPLFDKNGKVVGIVNAKHSDTDNVSYAIKARNLIGLFYMIPDTPVLDTNLMTGKTLPEKVRMAKNFVYIIEVNK